MIKVRSLCVSIIVIGCCTSCASVYVSSVRNVPLLVNGGDFQGNVSIGSGMNANAAYAPLNHVGLMVGAMYANDKFRKVDNTYRIHRSAEAAIGYFGVANRFSYELYVGYGTGKGYAQDSTFGFFFFGNSQDVFKANYRKVFVQPTFAFTLKRFQFAITTRIAAVDFRTLSVVVNGTPGEIERRRFYFFEPCFTAKFFISERPSQMFAFAQTGFNVSEQANTSGYRLPYSVLHYNVGFGVRLSRK